MLVHHMKHKPPTRANPVEEAPEKGLLVCKRIEREIQDDGVGELAAFSRRRRVQISLSPFDRSLLLLRQGRLRNGLRACLIQHCRRLIKANHPLTPHLGKRCSHDTRATAGVQNLELAQVIPPLCPFVENESNLCLAASGSLCKMVINGGVESVIEGVVVHPDHVRLFWHSSRH